MTQRQINSCLLLLFLCQDNIVIGEQDLSSTFGGVFKRLQGRSEDVPALGLHQSISPHDAKVGDTVTITCSFTAPENAYYVTLEKISRRNGLRQKVATNGYVMPSFSKTGRYLAQSVANDRNGLKEFVVTVTVTDAKVEDSGIIRCEAPEAGAMRDQELKVSEDLPTYGLQLRISPRDAVVGDTVTIACSYTAENNAFYLILLRRNENSPIRKKLATNGFLAAGLSQNGRYKANTEIIDRNGAKQFIVTVVIKGVKVEDSGSISCEAPADGAMQSGTLQVTNGH